MRRRINIKHIVISALIVLAALLVIAYFTGIFYQAITVTFRGEKINFNPFECFRIAIADVPLLFLVFSVIFGVLFLKLSATVTSPIDDLEKDSRGFNISKDGEYGTAHWQKKKELEESGFIVTKNVSDIDGFIFGILPKDQEDAKLFRYAPASEGPDYVGLPFKRRVAPNPHGFVVGTSGSGKTSRVLRLMIDTAVGRNESIVITDPKLELYADYKLYLESKGYKVRLMNLGDLSRTDTFNPLSGRRHDEGMIQQITKLIVDSAYDDAGTTHYTSGVQYVLTALVMYVCLSPDYTDEQANLITAHSILTRAAGDYKKLNDRFERLDANHPARIAWSNTKWGSENSRGNLFQEISLILQIFTIPGVRRFLMGRDNPIIIEDLGREKTALFISVDTSNKNLRLLGTLFFATVLTRLKALADSQPTLRLPVPVNMILDEVCTLDKIGQDDQQFITAINTDRSRGISYVLAGQDIDTFEAKFGKSQTQTIMGQCSVHFLTGVEPASKTAVYYSGKTGDMTTKFISTRYDSEGNASESIGSGKRNLVDKTEISRLLTQYNLVFVQGYQPIKVIPVPYEQMASFRYIQDHRFPVASIEPADLSEYALYVTPQPVNGLPRNAIGESEDDYAALPGDKIRPDDPYFLSQTPVFTNAPKTPVNSFTPPKQAITRKTAQNGTMGQISASQPYPKQKATVMLSKETKNLTNRYDTNIDTNIDTNNDTNIYTNSDTNIDTNITADGSQPLTRTQQAEARLFERLSSSRDDTAQTAASKYQRRKRSE